MINYPADNSPFVHVVTLVCVLICALYAAYDAVDWWRHSEDTIDRSISGVMAVAATGALYVVITGLTAVFA